MRRTFGSSGVVARALVLAAMAIAACAGRPAAPAASGDITSSPGAAKKAGAAPSGSAAASAQMQRADATTESIAMGDVAVLSISWSRTAAVFHAVDQLSAWSPFSHRQYEKWAPPASRTPEDSTLLTKHAALRTRLGRERGLEKHVYLASSSPRKALEGAVRAGIMTKEEADDESAVLEAWSAKLEAHLATDAVADDLRKHLRKEMPAFERLAKRWLAIADVPAPDRPIPLVIVPSPGQGVGGGGANGGVVVIEVPLSANGARSTLTTVGHELIHALLRPRWDRFEKAAARCLSARSGGGGGANPSADAMTISEGIAYAMAPGLFAYDDGIGELEKQAAHYTGSDHPYARFTKLAVALKPTVAKMLTRADAGERGMLDELLDAACAASSSPSPSP